MHSGESTAVYGGSWPNFGANLASFSLENRKPQRACNTSHIVCVCAGS
jgi:hypothetical protein